MQITGDFTFKGTRQEVWDLLNDESVLQKCMPGCERLTKTGPDEYAVSLKVGLAAIKGNYDGTMKVVDKRELESLTLKIDSKGSGGFANINGRMDLSGEGDATRLLYDWDVSVGGPVAMVGQRVLGGVAKMIIGEFFTKAQKELAARQS